MKNHNISQIIMAQLGARRHYAVPVLLHRSGILPHCYTDAYVRRGTTGICPLGLRPHSSLGGALGVTSFAALANEPDPERQGQYLAKVFRQATLLYIAAGSAVALLAPLLIVPLFGPGFAPAVLPAAILALATSLSALGTIFNEGLRGRGNTYPAIGAQILGGAMVVLCAWFWVPRYGLSGMAWAAVLGSLGQLTFLTGATLAFFPLRPSQLWGLRLGEVKILVGHLLSINPLKTNFFRGRG